ncbi:binding-protein-dependent transport systems inner membrane component [Kribbella flavida DSM 17836]|uniref:Binding-protein-dependent transport systems inner membrane component n=1 Tax=Kribbella flavida (strain DSM 17836 / JCM 10339 / NBRC 14399) TaxID=479435 RepID=D2PS57_KRIFD|nr:binding-protein-dependent transport systems inner membrane component [Kribbella flavida DSM 17836]
MSPTGSTLTREPRETASPPPPPDGGRRGRYSQRRRDAVTGYLFLTPWLIGLVAITLGPILASLYLAFTDYSLLKPPEWIGLANFEEMLTDRRLHKSLLVTFQYVFISVPLQLLMALGLAIVLNQGIRGLGFYRSVFYLPSLLAGSVSIAILWRQIFGQEGLVNDALGSVGIQGQSWVAHPDFALGTLILLNGWTFGAPMVIFLAGLRQIPASYYEAAAVDGAGRWTTFVHITLPLLTPIIFFNLVLQVIGAFQSFTQAFVVSGGTGGPADSTLLYTLYLYDEGFGSFHMGYASAMAWLLLAIIAALTAINFLFAKRWVFYGDE